MANDLNQCTFTGRLGRDPEIRAFASGDQICNIRLAVGSTWKDKVTGERRERTEWVGVIFNGKLAEIANQYLRKGDQILVVGEFRTREWERDGVKQYSTEIRADTMQMLGSKQGMGGGGDEGYAPQRTQQPPPQRQAQGQANSYEAARNGAAPPARAASGFDDFDDSIPFRDPLAYRGAHLVM